MPAAFKLIVGICIFLRIPVHAQYYHLPANFVFNTSTEEILSQKDEVLHAGMQPYIPFFDTRYLYHPDTALIAKKGNWLNNALFRRNFIELNKDSGFFVLKINPILNLEGGKDVNRNSDGTLYTNTRGIVGAGQIGERFYFETLFAENQSAFPNYLSEKIKTTQVVPGQGRYKNFKVNGFDYAFSSGFFSFQANSHVNVQAGHGKQKIGYGYRSLLLSDNAMNYPYLRITQQWFKGKLQYTNLWTVFMNLVSASAKVNPNTERLFQKKAAAFQYVSYNPTKWLNLGCFQALICQPGDSVNRQHLPWYYFNPIIGGSALTVGFDNKQNVLAGADARIKLSNSLHVYMQLAVDKFKKNRTVDGMGFQAGINYFNAFGIKHLRVQTEYNSIGKDCYLTTAGVVNYAHYDQTIAYSPVNGTELSGLVNYRYKRLFFEGRVLQQVHPWNKDPRLPSLSNSGSKVSIAAGSVGIIINPSYNLQLSAGALVRQEKFHNFSALNTNTTYFYLALRTSIYNFYYDM